jgi:Trk K+ transport system NAD-binding subunit
VEALGLSFVEGDAACPTTWTGLEPQTIQAVAVMLPDAEISLQVCRLLRNGVGIDQVIARVRDATQTQDFTDLGVRVVNPSLSPVVELEYMMLYPSVSSLMADLEDEHHIMEVRLECNDLAGRRLREITLPESTMMILVRRNGDIIHPRGETLLYEGDKLTLMGPLEGVRELARRCDSSCG